MNESMASQIIERLISEIKIFPKLFNRLSNNISLSVIAFRNQNLLYLIIKSSFDIRVEYFARVWSLNASLKEVTERLLIIGIRWICLCRT